MKGLLVTKSKNYAYNQKTLKHFLLNFLVIIILTQLKGLTKLKTFS